MLVIPTPPEAGKHPRFSAYLRTAGYRDAHQGGWPPAAIGPGLEPRLSTLALSP